MSKRRYSKLVAQTVEDVIMDYEWDFDDEEGIYTYEMCIDNILENEDEESLSCRLVVGVYDAVLYADFPISADTADSKAMAALNDYICYANYGLRYGCIELNRYNGKVRYRYSVDFHTTDCENDELVAPSYDVINRAHYYACLAYERCSEAMTAIIRDGASAAEAIEKTEPAASFRMLGGKTAVSPDNAGESSVDGGNEIVRSLNITYPSLIITE